MSYTAQDVKTLREKSGAGMMDCKKALDASGGDMEKAVEHLRKQGLAAAGKKASRIAAEGAVAAFTSKQGRIGALAELNCETDFVGKTDEFKALLQSIVGLLENNKPESVEALLQLKLGTLSVEEAINEKVAKIGEKITLRRFMRYEQPEGLIATYIHGGGSIGTMINFGLKNPQKAEHPAFIEMSRDLAMHVAASAPRFLTREEVATGELDKEKEIHRELLRKEGKPEDKIDRIVEGKIGKFYEDVCFLEQPFVKDPKTKVQQHLKNVGTQIQTEVQILSFTRYVLGEGIEKKKEDFAAEVMSQVKR